MPAPQAAALPRYIRQPEARRILGGITERGLKNLIARGIIPPPIELTCRLKVFRLDDVVAAVEKRARPPVT
jgi:hypothetical protein